MADDLVLRIAGDSTGGQQAVSDLANAFNPLSSKLAQTASDAQASGSLFSGVLDAMSAAIKNVVEDADGAASALKGAFENPLESAKAFGSAIQEQVVASLGALGPIVDGGIVVLGAMGAALIELASHAREVAESIDRISISFGVAIGPLSDLKFAIESAGGSFDKINNLMFMFQQRMENSSQTVQKGLVLIGLSLSDLASLSPDQQLLKISDAMRANAGSTDLATAAFDIFGRQGRDNLATFLKPLSDLTAQSRDFGATMGTDDVKAAADFQLSLNTLAAQTSATWTQLGLHVSIADEFVYAYDRMKLAVANVSYFVGELVTGFGYFGAAWDQLTGKLASMPAVNASLLGLKDGSGLAAKGLHDFQAAVDGQKLSMDASKDAWDQFDAQVGTVKQQLDAATSAVDKYKQQWDTTQEDINKLWGQAVDAQKTSSATGLELQISNLNTRQANELAAWQKRLDLGKVAREQFEQAVEAISERYDALRATATDAATKKYDDAWSKTQDDIDKISQQASDDEDARALAGLALKLSALQQKEDADKAAWQKRLDAGTVAEDQYDEAINAIDYRYDQLRNNARAQDERNITNQVTALWTDYYDGLAQKSGTTVQKQMASVQKWYDDQVDKAIKAGITDQDFYDNLYNVAQRKMQDVQNLNDPFQKAFTTMLDHMTNDPGGWTDTFGNKMAGALTGQGGFREVVSGVWDGIRSDLASVLGGMIKDLLNVFIGPAESALANWIAGLTGASSSSGGSSGWLSSLLGGGHNNPTPPSGSVPPGIAAPPGGPTPSPGPGADTPGGDPNLIPWSPGFGNPTVGSSNPNPGGNGSQDPFSEGGVVKAVYAKWGFPGGPSGTDTQPIWTTPGEGVLSLRGMDALGKLNSGQSLGGGGTVINIDASNATFRDRRSLQDLADLVAQALHDKVRTITPLSLR